MVHSHADRDRHPAAAFCKQPRSRESRALSDRGEPPRTVGLRQIHHRGVAMNSAQPITRAFLGVGWRFPLQVTSSGKIARSQYERRVEESIYLILSTAKGERVMLPDFGCGMHDLVFGINDPRTHVLAISADSSDDQPNLLLIRINYRVRANNAIGNLVYPFYINERT